MNPWDMFLDRQRHAASGMTVLEIHLSACPKSGVHFCFHFRKVGAEIPQRRQTKITFPVFS